VRRIETLLVLAVMLPCAAPAGATVIEVPLPALTGVYLQNGLPEPSIKNATVQLPALPSVIHGVSLRVHGMTAPGLFSCDTQYGYQPYWLPTQTSASMTPATGFVFTDRNFDSEVPGEFTWTAPFVLYGGATWSFLLDGTGDISMSSFCASAIPECYKQDPGANLTLDAVTLLVDGEFPTPAAVSTWGRIKAQYR